MTEAEKLVQEVAAILMGRVNAPEAEIYAAAREACAVVVMKCAEKAKIHMGEARNGSRFRILTLAASIDNTTVIKDETR